MLSSSVGFAATFCTARPTRGCPLEKAYRSVPSAGSRGGCADCSTPFLLTQKAQKKRLGEKKTPCKELSLAAASEEPPRLQRASFLKKA